MCEQISMIHDGILTEEQTDRLLEQAKVFSEYTKKKRSWENAFQKWSDNHGMQEDCIESWGACGYGSMCEWCKANDYGRPCVRALNAMCREKNISIDYSKQNFDEVWEGEAWKEKK